MMTHTFSYGELIWTAGALLTIGVLLVEMRRTHVDREVTRGHPEWFAGAGMLTAALVVADGHVREARLRVGKALCLLCAGIVAGTLPNGPASLGSYEITACFFGVEALLLASALYARRDRNRLLHRHERGEA